MKLIIPKDIFIRILIVTAALFLFSYKAGDISAQFTGDENFYFQSSKSMVETNDWLTPKYYGKPRFQKPFLYYWLVASSFKVFGIDWYAARVPSIMLAAFVVLLVYLIGRMLFNNTAHSILSAAILATTFKFFKYARFAIPDMALLFFITLSFYIFLKILKDKENAGYAAFFITLALATLTKGPIGLLIVVLGIAGFIIFSRERINIKAKDILCGALLYIAVVLPWFLIMFKLHGENYAAHLWARELVNRVGSHSNAAFFFYMPILAIRFLPWSLFLPKGIINSVKAIKKGALEKNTHILLLSWFFTVLILFTLMGEKHSQYMLALAPPFALLTTNAFRSIGTAQGKRILTLPVIIIILTIFSFLYFFSSKGIKLNNAILGRFAATMIANGLDEDDRIATGSHSLIPQHLEAYLERKVEKAGGKWYDSSYHDATNKSQLANLFKSEGKGAYCVIKRADYNKFISPELKKHLKIIYKDFLWKRKIDIGKISLGAHGFVENLKEEYYLITDK